MRKLRVEAAISCLAAVFVFRPQAPAETAPVLEVTSGLGAKFYSLPDEKGVVATAEKNLAADPKNAVLLLKLAQAQASVWQDREAVATLTRAIEIAPDDAALYTERGHRELPLREFSRALADLNRAVALNPKDVEAYYHLGLAHYFLGEFAPAAEAFRQAVELAPNADSRINSTNWVYASMRRAQQPEEASKALAQITPEMKNSDPHTFFYLSLVRFFQGRMTETEAVPPQPAAGSADTEAELRFDTVSYGVGNWYLYSGQPAKAHEYFRRIVEGRVWITWGFVGAETELLRKQAPVVPKIRRRVR
jgi:tetratricopeptide (TPR) repeat protein